MKIPLVNVAATLAVLAGIAVILIEVLGLGDAPGGWLWIIVGALAIAFGGYELLFGKPARKRPMPPG